jgi:hypothetical protein
MSFSRGGTTLLGLVRDIRAISGGPDIVGIYLLVSSVILRAVQLHAHLETQQRYS